MKEFFIDLLRNQIALALGVFTVIVIGAYITMGASSTDIVVQVITAVGALVTGSAIERTKNQRASDKPPTDEGEK